MNHIHKSIFQILKEKERPIEFAKPTDMLGHVVGAPFVGVVTVTEPKVRAGCPKLKRLAAQTLQVNYNYTNAVGNQLEREGKDREDYVPGETWYRALPATGLAEHKTNGTKYVRGRVLSTGESLYFDVLGNPIDRALAESYLAERTASSRAGTDKEIHARVFKLENVLALSMDGKVCVNPDASIIK